VGCQRDRSEVGAHRPCPLVLLCNGRRTRSGRNCARDEPRVACEIVRIAGVTSKIGGAVHQAEIYGATPGFRGDAPRGECEHAFGAGLNGEEPTPLLRGRIEKALRLWDQQGRRAVLVPSGGQGADEVISEAEAMHRFLRINGVGEESILDEDRSTTTMENLVFAKQLIEIKNAVDLLTLTAYPLIYSLAGRFMESRVIAGPLEWRNRAEIDAQIAEAKDQLGKASVIAPISGVVTAKKAQIGALTSGEALFNIAKDGVIELSADADAAELAQIKVGMSAQAQIYGVKEAVKGKVRLVPVSVDTSSRLGKVKISLDGGAKFIGSYAKAVIDLPEFSALALPAQAVSFTDEGAFATLIKDGKAQKRKIQTGLRANGLVQVISGISEDDEVALKAAALVNDGEAAQRGAE